MVGFNTEAAVRESLDRTGDADEVRWNFAYWLQSDLGTLCGSEADPDGALLRDHGIADNTLRLDEHGSASTAFVAVLEGTVRALHSTGAILEVFGKRLPVVIHELEYYDEIADQNRRANPSDLIAGFAAWVDG